MPQRFARNLQQAQLPRTDEELLGLAEPLAQQFVQALMGGTLPVPRGAQAQQAMTGLLQAAQQADPTPEVTQAALGQFQRMFPGGQAATPAMFPAIQDAALNLGQAAGLAGPELASALPQRMGFPGLQGQLEDLGLRQQIAGQVGAMITPGGVVQDPNVLAGVMQLGLPGVAAQSTQQFLDALQEGTQQMGPGRLTPTTSPATTGGQATPSPQGPRPGDTVTPQAAADRATGQQSDDGIQAVIANALRESGVSATQQMTEIIGNIIRNLIRQGGTTAGARRFLGMTD